LPNFEARAGFGTWLHRIAVNCSLDVLRKRRRRDAGKPAVSSDLVEELAETASHGPTPDQQLHHTEIHQRIESAMEKLTPMERTAFVLRHFEGQSVAEIGAALGAGTSATKQSIFRAVQKVRGSLESVVNATV
jgi:RNA polymerase sigma-70 factor (ECF subfamily)